MHEELYTEIFNMEHQHWWFSARHQIILHLLERTEQYLLQAFLAFNSEFEVLISNSYLGFIFHKNSKPVFLTLHGGAGGSFWMRRRQDRMNDLQVSSISRRCTSKPDRLDSMSGKLIGRFISCPAPIPLRR